MEPNRQERRAMKKLERSAETKNNISRLKAEVMVQRAEMILNKSNEPFILKDYNINIIPLAAFIIANVQNKNAIEHIEKRFYSANDFKDVVEYQQTKTELTEDEIYLAKLSKNIDLFLEMLAISKIDNESSMQTYISAVFEIASDYLTDIANDDKNVTLLSTANEPKALKVTDKKDRLTILAMLVNLFWGVLERFIDTKAVKEDLRIEIDDSLIPLISSVINDSEQYIKWLKQSISFKDAIINSGDIESEINDNDKEIILLKYTIAKQGLLYKITKKNKVVSTLDKVDDLEEKLETTKTKNKEKVDKLKKTTTELQKAVKDKDKELADIKKQLGAKDTEIKGLKGDLDKQSAEIANHIAEIDRLKIECEKQQNKEVDTAKIVELQGEIDKLQLKVNQLQTDCNRNVRTINILSTKLNQANNKIQLLNK